MNSTIRNKKQIRTHKTGITYQLSRALRVWKYIVFYYCGAIIKTIYYFIATRTHHTVVVVLLLLIILYYTIVIIFKYWMHVSRKPKTKNTIYRTLAELILLLLCPDGGARTFFSAFEVVRNSTYVPVRTNKTCADRKTINSDRSRARVS